jgi:hypothetical protein
VRRAILSAMLLSASACGPGAKVTANVVAGAALGSKGSGLSARQDALLASTSATSLLSLKYAITDIQVCEDLQRTGSGYSNPTGCFRVFQNPDIPATQDFYRDYVLSSALTDSTPGRFVDLMSAEGQATLRNPATAEPAPAGTYRYGLINFLRPIRVTAEFPVVGGQANDVVRTRATTSAQPLPGDGNFPYERALVGDTLSAAPAEETTYMMNNGGAYFAFTSPFVVSAADAAAGTPIQMDLVFNPANFGSVQSGDCAQDGFSPICDTANGLLFNMPFVRMSPVPRKAGEQTRKETYLVDFESGASASQLRVELYYNAADPERSVRGVDVALVYLPTATSPANNNVDGAMLEQTGSVQDGTATVTLQAYDGRPALSGIVRGQSGTATFNCAFPSGDICRTVGSSAQRAYTFVGDVLVSGD